MSHTYVKIASASSDRSMCCDITIKPDLANRAGELPVYQECLTETELTFYNQSFLKPRSRYAGFEQKSASLPEYRNTLKEAGQILHSRFFGQVIDVWRNILQEDKGSYNLHISPSLWWLPWELLYDQQFLFLDRMTKPIIRQVGGDSLIAVTEQQHIPKLYFVGSNSINNPTLADEQLEELCRAIPEDVRSHFSVITCPTQPYDQTQWQRFMKDVQKHKPDILHIVAHGQFESDREGLAFEGTSRDAQEVLVGFDSLIECLLNLKELKLLVIGACKSGVFFEKYPQLVRQLFQKTELAAAVVMADDVSAGAMIHMTKIFYQSLWSRLSIARAIGVVRSDLRSQQTALSLQWSFPMIYQSSSYKPFDSWLQQLRDYTQYAPLVPEHIHQAYVEAQQLTDQVKRLAELRERVNSIPASEVLIGGHVLMGISRFEKAMGMFNRRYSPEDQALLRNIEIISSRTFPLIRRFVEMNVDRDEGENVMLACTQLRDQVAFVENIVTERFGIEGQPE